MVVECFGRSAPSEGFAWSGVEGVSDRCDFLCAPAGQIGSLREVLAQKAVSVLIGAALPRALRISEVHLDTGSDRKLRMRRQFFAAVPGQ